MHTKTVGELGSTLPIGFYSEQSKQLVKSFSLRPYKSKVDRMMNIWREANEGKHIAWLVTKFMSLIVEEYGGNHFSLDEKGDSADEFMTKILDWHFSDVLYMYLWARIQVCNEMTVSYGCPNTDCTLQTAEARIDLKTVEVSVVDTLEECRFWVKLRDGFRLANGKRCTKIELQPVPFRTVLLQGGTQGNVDDSLGYNQLREAIVSVDGGGDRYILTDDELDEMTKIDQLILNSSAGKLTAGPKMRTTIQCDKCNNPIERALDWRFDHFFDSSIPVSHLMS